MTEEGPVASGRSLGWLRCLKRFLNFLVARQSIHSQSLTAARTAGGGMQIPTGRD